MPIHLSTLNWHSIAAAAGAPRDRPAAGADAKDMVIAATGERREIDVPGEGRIGLELVTLHRQGATTILGLDEQHRVRLMSFRGRGPRAALGTVEHVNSRFHDVGGLRLPGRVDGRFDGAAVAEWSGDYAAQVVNDPADATRFKGAPGG
jgi:hypothetical protein